jgi:hypothetical protein
MHEDNHAGTASTSSRFSHNETTNAISISYGFSGSEHSQAVFVAVLFEPA